MVLHRRKYWDENYVHSLENQVETLRALLQRQHVHLDPLPTEALDPAHATDVLASELAIESPAVSTDTAAITSGEMPVQENPLPPTQAGSQKAMEELSVMMWRTNLGDGVTIVNDDEEENAAGVTIQGPSSVEAPEAVSFDHAKPPVSVLKYLHDPLLLESLASLFLQNINQDHQFTEYTTTDFLQGFPSQPVDLTFLHACCLAVGATFSEDAEARASGAAFE